MPQLNQFHDIIWSQLFWLAVVFGAIFFGIGRMMLPKIESTVDSRNRRIAEDLAVAQRARAEADEVEAGWRTRTEAARAEAMKVTAAAKQDTARDAEGRIKAADAETAAKVEAAEARIRSATEAAMGEIEAVAAEAAEEMVSKLAGLSVGRERAAQAVKAVIAND
jgi:F-type H+-transporting ATPase subunit b